MIKKDEKKADTKTPEKNDPNASTVTPQKTTQEKQLDQLRKDIAAPPAVTLAGKFGGGGGTGSVKVETPTGIGRFTASPALTFSPQAPPNVSATFGLTTIVLGNRVDVGASLFINAPASKDSPFDVKYDDKTHFTTVTSTPALSGTGGFLGVRGQF